MHIRAQLPIFVPFEHRGEIEALSKAALMDLVWDMCATSDDPMAEFRARRDIVLTHRRQARGK